MAILETAAATTTTALGTSTYASPLPLTTTFTPPSACLNELWRAESSSSIWMNLGPINTTECLPSGWSPAAFTYFSPGICPSGWLVAASSTIIADEVTQTVGTCCPQLISGPETWTFSTRPHTSFSWPWYYTEICQWSPQSKIEYYFTYTTENGSTTGTTSELSAMTAGGVWNAYGIVIRWQSSDAVPSATTVSTSSATTQTATEQPSETHATLSSGAKAGIGVSVSIAGILIICALAFLFLRRRKRTADMSMIPPAPADLMKKSPADMQPAELASAGLFESSGSPIQELPGHAVSHPIHTGPYS
ncbi:hypothetical protein BO94DRAFT_615783 [Aspergillus sclerotioniger CBS 115572]|uniref:Uncharacterized protein n=1 Tax=Aspergillus sclerotioniger CBS 115572 TaxID=1450535 RepID=A0A317X5Z0_9EURO|nr:hypothetical protein BO94DRAFT_615783 [Aspergillus sclerotioniger CBS 115572]PWY93042.1 hypothetical protein BO94DRAFT_615783 [Aspergillus sclerotioniger CBS 115572]